MQATTAIVLDRRTGQERGVHPVKIRVTYDRISRLYSTGVFLSAVDFEKCQDPKSRGKWRSTRIKLSRKEDRAQRIIDRLGRFTFDSFKKNFTTPGRFSRRLSRLFDSYISELKEQERIGSAISYNNAKRSFESFKRSATIDEVTQAWLSKYEKWMLYQGKSRATIGIYCRSLRTIYNNGIHAGIVSNDAYPFGRRAYRIPKGAQTKKALDMAQLKKIFDYVPETEGQDRARDFFLLSYLCNGANTADLLRLRFRDIDAEQGIIRFIRTKTKNTGRTSPVLVELVPETGRLLEKWRQPFTDPNDYVFGVIGPEMSAEAERKRIRDFNNNLNRRLKVISKNLGLGVHFSMYTARHTYATVLKRSGVPIAFISEALGHQSIRTTQHYLASFEREARREYAKALVNFDLVDSNGSSNND